MEEVTQRFERSVDAQIEKLHGTSWNELNAEVAQKRVEWLKARNLISNEQHWKPRQAYELFFKEYLGIDLDQVPVVFENEEKILWHSKNRCKTLEACTKASLDTREVCRAVYEQSTQAFFSALDPALQFHRSYVNIRPYTPYCEEWLIRITSDSSTE